MSNRELRWLQRLSVMVKQSILSIFELCSIKHAELKHAVKQYKGRVCFRGDHVKTAEGTHAVFWEQGTSSAHMAATKFLDLIARLPDNDGLDSDAVGANTQLLLSEAAELLGIDVIPDTWISLPRMHRPASWDHIEDPVCPLLRNLRGHPLAGLLWEKCSQQQIFVLRGWKDGKVCTLTESSSYLWACTWMTSI